MALEILSSDFVSTRAIIPMPPNVSFATNNTATLHVYHTPHTPSRAAALTLNVLEDPLPTIVHVSPDVCHSDGPCTLLLIARYMPLDIRSANVTLTTALGSTVQLEEPSTFEYKQADSCISRLCTLLSFAVQTPPMNPDGTSQAGTANLSVCVHSMCAYAMFDYIAVDTPVVELLVPNFAYSHVSTLVDLHIANFQPIEVNNFHPHIAYVSHIRQCSFHYFSSSTPTNMIALYRMLLISWCAWGPSPRTSHPGL